MSTVPTTSAGPYREPAEAPTPVPRSWIPTEILVALQHQADLRQYVRRFHGKSDGLPPTDLDHHDVETLLTVRSVLALEAIAAALTALGPVLKALVSPETLRPE